MTRWALLVAGLALVPSACGSGRHRRRRRRRPSAPPAAPRRPERKPASTRDVAVIRGWADALRHGDVERAVGYFAIPSVVSNGTAPIRLTGRDDVRIFNRTLPCGAKVLHAEDTGAFVVATFRLTERPGPGRCGTGAAARPAPRS